MDGWIEGKGKMGKGKRGEGWDRKLDFVSIA